MVLLFFLQGWRKADAHGLNSAHGQSYEWGCPGLSGRPLPHRQTSVSKVGSSPAGDRAGLCRSSIGHITACVRMPLSVAWKKLFLATAWLQLQQPCSSCFWSTRALWALWALRAHALEGVGPHASSVSFHLTKSSTAMRRRAGFSVGGAWYKCNVRWHPCPTAIWPPFSAFSFSPPPLL